MIARWTPPSQTVRVSRTTACVSLFAGRDALSASKVPIARVCFSVRLKMIITFSNL